MEPFLIYKFRNFKYEFIEDYILITDLNWNRTYKMIFNPNDPHFPFIIQLIIQLEKA